jgi:predicted HTH transcriptional regulator
MKSEFVSETLATIKQSIENDVFIDVEKSKVELKDLSNSGDWKSLNETICAFLNSEGGIVICGIREKNKKYTFTGFNRNNESKLIDLQTIYFKNDIDVLIDVSDNIIFDYESFLDNEVAVIAVFPLSDDKKYVKYNNEYYERKLTQDRKMAIAKIQRQKEYKIEIEYAKELAKVTDATIEDLSIDKINYYINLLNKEIRNETLKANHEQAKSFLSKQHFIKEDNISTLGMLVCGDDPFHFLGSRVEVNCYYDTSIDIGKDKKLFRNDVINLMEDTFRYIWGHIKINRTIRDGGKSEPEYPEKLIRETINNALAHRDYTIDNFVTVTVEPNKYIEIKNPGYFKEKIKLVHTETAIPVRRLIAGIPESKNPKLASVLKVFDKIESQGRGMASLVNEALDNEIDLPIYEIKDGMISLKISSGKLVDESIETWIGGFETYIVSKLKSEITAEHKAVLAYFYKSELVNRQRLFAILLTESNNHFIVINALKEAKIIIEHPASSEENPVYVLDRVLMKTDFIDEFINLLGNEYIHYDEAVKQVLNMIYLFTKYNNKSLKAADITPEVYRRIYGREIIAKTYESLGRKIRNICNSFEKQGILHKGTKNDYTFNVDYKSDNTLFK